MLELIRQSANSGGLWGPMDGGMIEVLADVAYLFGGWAGAAYNADWPSDGSNTTNLVYRTIDKGVTWQKIRDHDLTPDATHFTRRHFAGHCTHMVGGTEYIYLLCGDSNVIDSDNRRTVDGVDWVKVNSVQPGYHGTVLAAAGSLGGKLYLGGGHYPVEAGEGDPDLIVATAVSTMWMSDDDGATYESLGSAPWPVGNPQDKFATFAGKLWRVGGGAYDNTVENRTYDSGVWSFDGSTWTEVLEDGEAPWTARIFANVFAWDGWLYISRGFNHLAGGNLNDTWRTQDGVNWSFVYELATLVRSHADGAGVLSDGVLFATGNGYLGGSPQNTDSPTYLLRNKVSAMTISNSDAMAKKLNVPSDKWQQAFGVGADDDAAAERKTGVMKSKWAEKFAGATAAEEEEEEEFNPAGLFTGGGLGGFWDFTELTSLWQDQSGTSPVTSDGQSVLRADDLSGNGNHMVSADGPTYQIEGSRLSAIFSATAYLSTAAIAKSAAFTVLSAFRINTLALQSLVTAGSAGGVGALQWATLGIDGSGKLTYAHSDGTNASDGATSAAAVVIDTDYIAGASYAGGGATAQVIYLGATTPAVTPGTTAATANSGATQPLALGRLGGFAGQHARADMFGALVIDRVLTTQEIADFVAYYTAKMAA